MKNFHIKTFGCQMNYSDSERMSAFLKTQGFQYSPDLYQSDVVIINTCGVRQMAEDRVYGLVRNIKKNNPKTKVVIAGCIAHRNDVQKRLDGQVEIFTTIKEFPKKLLSLREAKRRSNLRILCANPKIATLSTIARNDTNDYLEITPDYQSSFSAFVPVMTGCNNFCAYCVVPYAREREYSRPAAEIIKEVKNLIKNGYKEITLIGQNVNSYKSGRTNFAHLFSKINKIPGDFWIRFITSHPKDMSNELIETIAKSEKVCSFVNLPLQAGNDKTLKRMNRKYTVKHYLKLIEKIRKAFIEYRGKHNGLAISTDIIVGFPGETKKQFADSKKILEKIGYDMIYINRYSPRPQTLAWKMKDDVSKEEKKRRWNELNKILKKSALKNNKKLLGKTVLVLVESKDKKGNYFGKTEGFKHVKFKSRENLIGSFVKIKITHTGDWNLEGKIP